MTDLQAQYNIVSEARALVAQGWTRGQMENNDGEICTLGALNKATFGRAYRDGPIAWTGPHADYQAVVLLFTHLVTGGLSIPSWNDTARSKRKILKGFDRVLKHLAKEIHLAKKMEREPIPSGWPHEHRLVA